MAGENELMEQLEYLKNLMENIDSRMNLLLKTLEESGETIALLKDNDYQKSSDVKISIGSGLFSKATLDTGKIIVPVGSNVFIEEEREKTVKRMEDNIKSLQDTYNNLIKQKQTAQNNYDALVYSIQRSQEGSR
ncbi:MAG: prefoldin subunit alpha [Candidatus Thermoplasmatota archaeon]|jgi:prefoldin alpha subunit|uniref:prefoldin subunit alpha n=1 Tax=Ferroplasma sp. TaxID=2591003 RepID=UPI002629206A|nr:prefoldin subunit alpha [Ferroplasma sp.]MCL4312215.1 prefoldin subunit alpha [Candidatus Thermoplasmatota archaeon]